MCWSAFRLGRIIRAYPMASCFTRRCEASSGDARRCRAPHHEGPRPHPEERALARVSKDEATELENALIVFELVFLVDPVVRLVPMRRSFPAAKRSRHERLARCVR